MRRHLCASAVKSGAIQRSICMIAMAHEPPLRIALGARRDEQRILIALRIGQRLEQQPLAQAEGRDA